MTNPYPFHELEEYTNRLRKLEEIKKCKVEPYPHTFERSHHITELHTLYANDPIGTSSDAEEGKTPFVRIAGRLVLFRAMGTNAFGQIQDQDGRMQFMCNKLQTEVSGYLEEPSQTALKFIEKHVDLGDIIGMEGHVFRTQKGEITLYVKKFTLLAKTLLSLPEKHKGLTDKEIRYRKRWLDLISNDEVKKTFQTRSRIFQYIRSFFAERKFLEVETPILESIYGGAEARPFVTELNALKQEMFLRISLEIPLKKLIIGGMDRVFEMGKVFRNEGIDRSHNPEFTLLEAYAAYFDYNDMMELIETLFEGLAKELFGSTLIPANHPETNEPIELNMKAPWIKLTMKESIKKYAHIDVDSLSDQEMYTKLLESGHIPQKKLDALSRGLMIAAFFEIFVEQHLIQPHHIIDHPEETTPLCKWHRDPAHAGLVERFESFILCGEMSNAYTELNDPIKQRQLLEMQAARKEAGDSEASPLDKEFIEALYQGMPPCGGIGIGIDRLIMLFTNSHSIRDVLYFPWMKPQ
jgi:lysyl-tRNA synthetase, class II